MSLHIEENTALRPLTTLGITATADFLIHITEAKQLPEAVAFAADKQLPIFILGGGSNVVLGQDRLQCVALKVELSGREILEQTADHTDIKVGAGENWDAFVGWTVEQNLSGIEALSLIPGTVGGAPVQNVGAYGQEVKTTITNVEAFDTTTGEIAAIPNADCEFAYRDSMFKHEGKNRYIVTAVTFRLLPADKATLPEYATLQAELDRRNITTPTIKDIRESVIAVRQARLPNPAITPTAGSFFHNPIIATEEAKRALANHPDLPNWPVDESKTKLSAAWMVEQCGFKGQVKAGVGIYDQQALALINPGHKSAKEVLAFRDQIIAVTKQKFGVTLTMEPELISF